MYDEKEMRKISINSENHNKFCSNIIKTAKYNWITFLPLSIAYQFKNYFNIFFLFTAIILAIKVISPMDPGTAIGPFIVVILISVIKEGVEDYVKYFLLTFLEKEKI
jgi:magnesium-transporting ATPase (P-type)